MLYCGMDLSRNRLEFCCLDRHGERVDGGGVRPDREGLAQLAARVQLLGGPVLGVIESMNGARFVHDVLVQHGFEVEIADAFRAKRLTEGLTSRGRKTDRVDAWALAELGRLGIAPAIWLPHPHVREERERARFRIYLAHKRTALKNRVQQTLLAHGLRFPVSDLFGSKGRRLLAETTLPPAWQHSLRTSLELIDHLDTQIDRLETELRQQGADHPYVPLLCTIPGISWVLAYTIAAEIGDISRFPTARHLVGYTGLCARVNQSGDRDHRGPLRKNGPDTLRWALIAATTHACHHPAYAKRYHRTRARLGTQRGPKVAQVELARSLTKAIWWMLTRNQPFAPGSAPETLVA